MAAWMAVPTVALMVGETVGGMVEEMAEEMG